MAEKEPNWEFNCPQFVDFTSNPHERDDGADEWFDRGTNVAIPSLASVVSRSSNFKVPLAKKDAFSPVASPRVKLFTAVRPSSPLMNSPVIKRLRLSDESTATVSSADLSRRRRPFIASGLLNHARKTIRTRLLSNRKAAGQKTRLSNRIPMASLCQNTEAREQPDEGKQLDFVASLRHYDPPAARALNAGVLKSTMPVPFKLSQPVKKPSKSLVPFRSIAEQVVAFQKHTPLRFRTQKTSDDSSVSSASSSQAKKQKKAVRRIGTPRLFSMARTRPANILSHDEKEQLEVEEMKKFKFHAKPVNMAVLNEKAVLPEVEKRPTTTIQPFNICDERRPAVESHPEPELPKTEFVARPIPKGLFATPRLRLVQSNELTDAKSPAFHLKARAQERQCQEDRQTSQNDEPEVKVERPYKAANFIDHFIPKLDHKSTEAQPFKFEERDKDRQKIKEQKIREILEEEKRQREFHANPLPPARVSGLPEKSVLPSTIVVPFQLQADERGEKKNNKFKEQMEQELLQLKEQARFKAQPCTVTTDRVYVPQKIARRLTSFACVDLQTEKRAKEREAFNATLKAKEVEMDEIRRKREAEREEEERKVVAELRASAVHHAQPVRHFKEVHVETSDRSPTNPQSPNLITKKRKRN